MIIFTHVPRTGGTTLQGIAAKQYRPEEILRLYGDAITQPQAAITKLKQYAVIAEIRFLTGHNAYGIHKELPFGMGHYLTILRDPIERAISVYEYIKRSKGHHLHQAAQGLPLKQFMQSGITTELDNGMTRQISGECGELPQKPWPDVAVPVGAMTRTHLDLARIALRDSYAVVGITEHMDSTVELCRRRFGWEVGTYESRNVSRNRRERWRFSEETMLALEEHNRLDLELYDFGCQLFEAALVA